MQPSKIIKDELKVTTPVILKLIEKLQIEISFLKAECFRESTNLSDKTHNPIK
jgi:hypothetical protein